MKHLIIYILFVVVASQSVAQQNRQIADKSKGSADKKSAFIKPDVRAWKMTDQYTLADTIPVDTLTNGHQINNLIWKNNVMNVTLGNNGSPYQSMLYINKRRTDGNIFYNSLQQYLDQPIDFVWYNTKSPYTNLAYQMGYPKRRSEEFVQVLFTQNVNRRLNVGAHYKFLTSIGKYESQRADHASVRLFSSFDGDYYKYNFTAIYNRSEIKENGGILNDNYILYPDSFDYDKAEDIPVQFMDQSNRHSAYQILYAHQLTLGTVDRFNAADSTTEEVPVATAFHKIHLFRNHHEFRISDLSNYADIYESLFPNAEPLNDFSLTADSVRYSHIDNIFQLKLNEEFNSLLRFGVRVYIGNVIRRYHWPAASTFDYDDNENLQTHYHTNSENRVSSYVGGQIFKNTGEHLRLNAGAQIYFQGYNVGDFNLNGYVQGMFPLGKISAQLWAKASLDMRSPELFEEKYTSNHFQWSNDFERTKILNYSGGLRLPELNLELTVFGGTQNNKIYYNEEGLPDQKGGVVQVIGAYLYKHFSVIGFNSINRVAVQKTSDDAVEPLPLLAIYSSNFYERLLFNVLTFQIGFDWRYNSNYYAPKYIPALMQFAAQTERKVGNYHYIDPFVNLQLKRARIYIKYEHVNSLFGSKKNYFHTIHYPANPGFIKFGVSWNFYD